MAARTVLISLSEDEFRDIVRDAVRAELSQQTIERDVLTTAQAADLLGTHPVVVRRWVRERGLPANKIGSTYRFNRADVLDWMKKQGEIDSGNRCT